MRSTFSVADPDCMVAVRKYADELVAAGLPVRVEETPIDDGWVRETAVSVEWGEAAESEDAWDAEEDEWGDGGEGVQPSIARGLDAGQGRLAEHYLRTLRLLAHNVDVARAWAGARGRLRRKKG